MAYSKSEVPELRCQDGFDVLWLDCENQSVAEHLYRDSISVFFVQFFNIIDESLFLSGSQYFAIALDSKYTTRNVTDWFAGPCFCLSATPVLENERTSDKNDASGN